MDLRPSFHHQTYFHTLHVSFHSQSYYRYHPPYNTNLRYSLINLQISPFTLSFSSIQLPSPLLSQNRIAEGNSVRRLRLNDLIFPHQQLQHRKGLLQLILTILCFSFKPANGRFFSYVLFYPSTADYFRTLLSIHQFTTF